MADHAHDQAQTEPHTPSRWREPGPTVEHEGRRAAELKKHLARIGGDFVAQPEEESPSVSAAIRFLQERHAIRGPGGPGPTDQERERALLKRELDTFLAAYQV